MQNEIYVRKFPYEYVKLFGRLPTNKVRGRQMVNTELRGKLRKLKIPMKVLPKNFDSMIFLGYRGSFLFGSNKKGSDIDLVGSFINPIEYYIGLGNNDIMSNFVKIEGKWDITCFEIKRLFKLLSRGDFNFFPSLFIDQEYIIYESQEWKRLRVNKRVFKSLRFPINVFYYGKNFLGDKSKSKNSITSSHIIRLISMASEYVKTGDIIINRNKIDNQHLGIVKEGGYKIETTKDIITKSLRDLEILIKESNFKVAVDCEKVDKLLTGIIINFNKREGRC